MGGRRLPFYRIVACRFFLNGYAGSMSELSPSAEHILSPRTLTHPGDVRRVPSEPGIYGWWVRAGSLDVPAADYQQHEGFELLYVGISPRRPSAAGGISKSNLRKRLNQHVNGNASRSTLRRTLGVLLMETLDMTLVLRNGRPQWVEEASLTRWMHENARVAYVIDHAPWHAEDELLEHATLALNIDGRATDEFARSISVRRSAALAAARSV